MAHARALGGIRCGLETHNTALRMRVHDGRDQDTAACRRATVHASQRRAHLQVFTPQLLYRIHIGCTWDLEILFNPFPGLVQTLSGQNLFFSDVPSQTRVANHFAVASSVRGVPLMHGWMELIKPHPTM